MEDLWRDADSDGCSTRRFVDRNRFTGQNPASAAPLAQELLKALN